MGIVEFLYHLPYHRIEFHDSSIYLFKYHHRSIRCEHLLSRKPIWSNMYSHHLTLCSDKFRFLNLEKWSKWYERRADILPKWTDIFLRVEYISSLNLSFAFFELENLLYNLRKTSWKCIERSRKPLISSLHFDIFLKWPTLDSYFFCKIFYLMS